MGLETERRIADLENKILQLESDMSDLVADLQKDSSASAEESSLIQDLDPFTEELDDHVAVDSVATPGYIGDASNNGVLQTRDTTVDPDGAVGVALIYVDEGDNIVLASDPGAIKDGINGLDGYDGMDGDPSMVLPDSNADTPIRYTVELNPDFYSDESDHENELQLFDVHTVRTQNAIPWFYGMGGSHTDALAWLTVDNATQYKVLQVGSTGVPQFDWVRAHG